jgi:hypothetical protein
MLAGLAAAVLGLVPMAASADEFFVVDSSAPGVPAGATLVSGTPISVPAKGRVVLLTSSGQMVTVNGPFSGMPSVGPADKTSQPTDAYEAVKVLFAGAGNRKEAGVVRAAEIDWRRDHATTIADVLAVDATDGGDACLYDPSHAAVLHNPSNIGTMTIHAMDNNASATIEWGKGVATAPWPSSLPIADGAAYLFEESNQNAAALVTVHLLKPPPAPAPAVDRVAQLAQAGCRDQAKLMLALYAKEAK